MSNLARPSTLSRELLGDLLARTLVGALFLILAISYMTEFRQTGRITGLFFVVSEALVVVFTIVRRRASLIDRSIGATLLTMLSTLGPPLLRPWPGPSVVPDVLSALLSSVGLILVIVGKVTLGRSFGLVPANRGVVARGPYSIVRHPIYSGYLLSHAAVLLAYPRLLNIAIIAIADSALVWRAMLEERVLARDTAYQAYCQRVAWHLVPGVF
jgi:protein-S-isoprenylcysteine O-methyltransferase Ste14